jgi:hypothetical protein
MPQCRFRETMQEFTKIIQIVVTIPLPAGKIFDKIEA